MSEAHRRKKQPQVVRSQLLEVAARLCVENGLHTVTLDAVARAAGVSKGGLLHHFPAKRDLLDALHEELLRGFEARLEELMAQDVDPHGRFTRAYLLANLDSASHENAERWNSLAVLLLAEATMRERWGAWISNRLSALGPEEKTVAMQIVRTAADGLWLAELTGIGAPSDREREQMIEALLAMTRNR
ncbi:TetR/AcrR family transcriptional regulator [Xanthobacter sp. V2C-8]|uniref:TetR/AcrR family transcriptional regulator n=1 Tax=Xanthobacter albus TaxID=3119929 RepID=UPI00372BA5C3